MLEKMTSISSLACQDAVSGQYNDIRNYLSASFQRMQNREDDAAYVDLFHHVAKTAECREVAEVSDAIEHKKISMESQKKQWLLQQVELYIEELWRHSARQPRDTDDVASFFFSSEDTVNQHHTNLSEAGILRRLKILDIIHANLVSGTTCTKRYRRHTLCGTAKVSTQVQQRYLLSRCQLVQTSKAG